MEAINQKISQKYRCLNLKAKKGGSIAISGTNLNKHPIIGNIEMQKYTNNSCLSIGNAQINAILLHSFR